MYLEVKRLHGFSPELAYCIALCNYRLNRLVDAVQMIIELKTHITDVAPEL
jgi:tetratricopeptide repeat protein 30